MMRRSARPSSSECGRLGLRSGQRDQTPGNPGITKATAKVLAGDAPSRRPIQNGHAGGFGCWREGVSQTWCAKQPDTMTDTEREAPEWRT